MRRTVATARPARVTFSSLVTVSPTSTNAHAHPALSSHPSGHGEFNIIDTSLTSGQSCLRASTRSRWSCSCNLPSVTYSSMYRPRMFLRWDVVLVSAFLYPRTMRQPYSYFKGSVVSLTEYTVKTKYTLKTLFPNAELNLLSPGSGCPLQAGTGHGRPGRAPGLC